jgi:hypothetical protein
MARRQIEIDRDKLRAALRKLPHEYVFDMLDDAVDLLPPANAQARALGDARPARSVWPCFRTAPRSSPLQSGSD